MDFLHPDHFDPEIMSPDIENKTNLLHYLISKDLMKEGESIKCEILRGGVSNKTVWLELPNGDQWVLKQALSKLRVKEEWWSEPDRIAQEALGMQHLSSLLGSARIPEFIFFDQTHHILAMTAIPHPHSNYKQQLLAGHVEPEYFRQFGQILGQLHAQASKRTELAQIFSNRTYFENLRLEPYYLFTASKVLPAKDFLYHLSQSCREDCYTLVHGDYSPKNILIHQGQLVLLDHEVIHYGDGTFDIGFAMSHMLSKANHLKRFKQEMIDCAHLFWQSYVTSNPGLGKERELRAVQHSLACMLARVHGRSPLEYLTKQEQHTQSRMVLHLIERMPLSISQLIDDVRRYLTHDNN